MLKTILKTFLTKNNYTNIRNLYISLKLINSDIKRNFSDKFLFIRNTLFTIHC